MRKNIHVIIGNNEDYHAAAIAWAIRSLGEESLIWDGIGSNSKGQISLQPGTVGRSLKIAGIDLSRKDIGSLWIRRPVKYQKIRNVTQKTKSFVEGELNYAYLNLVSYLRRKAKFTICSPYRIDADCKSFQLDLAASFGLEVPETIITNNYDDVVRFSKDAGKIIYKPFNPYMWNDSVAGNHRIASTMIIDDLASISPEAIQLTPGIYQKYIEKDYELRITVIGDKIFAAKISKKEGGSFIDWRFHIESGQASVEKIELESDLKSKILNITKELNLKYGCFDFVVSKGVPYFLEVNPTGQFLFIEHFVPEMPLLAAFASFMLSGTLSYQIKDYELLSLRNFEKTEDFRFMMESRGKVMWKNDNRSNI